MRKWSRQDIALIERLRANGLTYSQIACNVGATKSAISSLFRSRIEPVIDTTPKELRWRLRELIRAGYGPNEAAHMIDAPIQLAERVFDEMHTRG